MEKSATAEDFLPIVTASRVDFRFPLRPISKSKSKKSVDCSDAIQGISAYQVIAQTAHAPHRVIWNSGKIHVDNKQILAPSSVKWDGRLAPLKAGSVVKWKVLVWDFLGQGPQGSDWSKFGVGPDSGNWDAEWITHPNDSNDFDTLSDAEGKPHKRNLANHIDSEETCSLWKHRLPLPIARAQFNVPRKNEVVGALVVASGLGMFSVSMNGKRLSSSSVHDPPLTDFAQRVSYRGFDVTKEIVSRDNHTLSMELGSGWWDPRPINPAIVTMDFMPTGSLTAIAQLHLQYRDGEQEILVPTGDSGNWMVGKGHRLESNLYTGEKIDLKRQHMHRGWDSFQPSSSSSIKWVTPHIFEGSDFGTWREDLDQFAVHRERRFLKAIPPIGMLVPLEIPPVLPVDKIAPTSTTPLGDGRWLLDFGKGTSGVVRFESGLPVPYVPEKYPRAHNLSMAFDPNDKFISIVYGDSLELTTGDINMALVAGYGHHSGGERGESKPRNLDERGGKCFPPEDLVGYQALTQRDVFVVPRDADPSLFVEATQPHFAVHGFRYAEVCCSHKAPVDAFAIQYRTAYEVWGKFDSSNPVLNGAYEMSKNAFESNTLGIQSDCPHRERLQYGGDIVSSSPAFLHMYDMSAFYRKVVRDWTDSQFSNGAYGTTSVFMDLLAGESAVGQGAGETVWASVAPVMTARHMRYYGDLEMAKETLQNHDKWFDLLLNNWDAGMKEKFGNIKKYRGTTDGGLGDWLAIAGSDSWLMHQAFFLATARSIAYATNKVLQQDPGIANDGIANAAYKKLRLKAFGTATQIERNITRVFKGTKFSHNDNNLYHLGHDLAIFSRIVNGKERCQHLANRLSVAGDENTAIWPGDEENLFIRTLSKKENETMMKEGHVKREENKGMSSYKVRYAIITGIFGVRYGLRTLSDNGFHSLALTKASGSFMPSFGMMLSFNSTTLWETFWRSEDIFSRNHPMLGAIAEWLASSVAGISLSPTSIGGKEFLFWPRLPSTLESASIINEASATQGSKMGTAAIAWKLKGTTKTLRQVMIRMLVPPGSTAELRLPPTKVATGDNSTYWRIERALDLVDLDEAQSDAQKECEQRRKRKDGFPFHWHYDRKMNEFNRVYEKKEIGTPCESFLFMVDPIWKNFGDVAASVKGSSTKLKAGLYQVTANPWILEEDVPVHGYQPVQGDMGPFCEDSSTFDWNIDDAEHLI